MSIPPRTSGYRDELSTLEDEFAEAMSQLYRVGSHLARVRVALERDAGAEGVSAPPPVVAPVPSSGPVTTTAPAGPVPAPQATPAGAVPAPPQAPEPVRVGAPVAPAAAAPAAPPRGPVTAPPAPPASPFAPAPLEPWWQRDGVVARLLAVVGAGITLIGVAFLLAIAIQAGIFGPLARVLSGAVLSAALLGAAAVVRRRQESPVGALGLAATGVAAAYLDVLAVTRIYDWVPAALGLVVAGLLAAGGLVIARAWRSQLLAVLVVVGVAVLAPVVGGSEVLLVGAFLLTLTIASYPAQVGRSWPVLEVARVVPTTLYAVVAVAAQDDGHEGTLMALVLALFVLATTLAPLVRGLGTRAGLPAPLAALALVAALPALLAGGTEDRPVAVVVLLVLAAAHLVAAWVGPVAGVPALSRLRELSLVVAALALLLLATRGPGESFVPLALLVVAVGWVAAAAGLRSTSVGVVALPVALLALLPATRHLPALVSRSQADRVDAVHVLEAVCVVVLLALVALALRALVPGSPEASRVAVCAAALALPLPLVLGGSVLGRAAGLGDDPAASGFLVGHALATVVWMALAAGLLVRGLGRSEDAGVSVLAGLGLAATAVVKLLFFDLSALDGLPRVLSFIVAGVLLLAMGAGYASALERARRARGAVENPAAQGPPAPTV
ncbi:DUF2339 domain-containing protein [Janibacter melonis]|uniref:DUF2339 domain-containing protein n=1 Tax=Janibacter melonis TaxID=262209 RepID=UPI001919C104|nr:DUF2339 domain-containing protein [Janibacter melonis]